MMLNKKTTNSYLFWSRNWTVVINIVQGFPQLSHKAMVPLVIHTNMRYAQQRY